MVTPPSQLMVKPGLVEKYLFLLSSGRLLVKAGGGNGLPLAWLSKEELNPVSTGPPLAAVLSLGAGLSAERHQPQ